MKATNASFYYTLKQLERGNFIKAVGSKQEGNRPEQIIYKLLNKGKQEFKEQISYYLNQVQEIYFDVDAVTPFILLLGTVKGKQFILDSIDKQINKRKKMFQHVDEGERLVESHFLYKLSPFYILPLKHWRFHNMAEIKWLEYFRDMVNQIGNFEEQYTKLIKKMISKTQD